MKLSEAVSKIHEVATSEEGCRVFEGFVGDDMNWRVNAVPQGGYVLGLLFCAIRSAQRGTPHPDPMHLTAHYLASLGDGQFRIDVRSVKRGRSFANIDAKLIQKEKLCIAVHTICGTLPPLPNANRGLPRSNPSTQSSPPKPSVDSLIDTGLLPPSPLARHIPLCHPLAPPPATRLRKVYRPYKFTNEYVSIVDTQFDSRNAARAQGIGLRQGGQEGILEEVGNGSFEVGEWFTLTDREEVIDDSMIPFFGDMMVNLPDLLPKEMRGGYYWYPTVTLSLSLLYRLPSHSEPSSGFSKRTIGLYSQARFLSGPSGRHDAYVELWTAPEGCDLDTGSPAVDPSRRGMDDVERKDLRWKEKMVCLATSHQMALALPMSVNESKRAKEGADSTPSAKM